MSMILRISIAFGGRLSTTNNLIGQSDPCDGTIHIHPMFIIVVYFESSGYPF